MKIRSVLNGAMLLSMLIVASAQAAPEPSPTPVKWELSLTPSSPMRIEVDLGSGRQTFWYLLYTVTNNTGREVDFHPNIVRVNEIESEVPADMASSMPEQASRITVDPAIVGPRPKVFSAIRELHAKTHPFLVRPVDAITTLRQGKDNALTSVAIFKDLDVRVSKFTVFFSGLSGERLRKPNPAYKPDTKGSADRKDVTQRFFLLTKTLAMPYTLPGDVRTRRYATPILGRMKWVMR